MTTHLTSDQLEHYHKYGYTVAPAIFPRSELAVINQELDRILEEKRAKRTTSDRHETKSGWIMSLGLASPLTRNICADTRLLDLVQEIVHPGIAIYSAKMVSKEPYTTDICHWHQDDAYYTQKSQSKTRMSVWIPLQDTTIDQGCLQIIPSSHKRGLQPYSPKKGGTCNLGIDTKIDLTERVFCEVAAGSVVLFSALLWHASEGNKTDVRRRAFIVSYQEATVMGGNGQQWKVLRPA
ncbi:phytanoyl-CoA dioxygenase family protein [Chloroflexi bacterium TSY]|nr:phytanoyl-CoA dioxygenase family protein [Chloroflexi bacterium TSY]